MILGKERGDQMLQSTLAFVAATMIVAMMAALVLSYLLNGLAS